MIKKTIQFEDFNGEAVSDDFRFHLTEADLAKMEMSKNGFEEYVSRITKAVKGAEIVELFDSIIRSSYGVTSPDGKRFVKNAENLEEFVSSNAYSVLFLELCTDANAAAEFVNGIMPESAKARVRAKDQLQGQRPQMALDDEVWAGEKGISNNLAEHLDVQDKPKQNRNISKAVLVAKAKIKQGQKIPITTEILDAMTAAELSYAIDQGCELV